MLSEDESLLSELSLSLPCLKNLVKAFYREKLTFSHDCGALICVYDLDDPCDPDSHVGVGVGHRLMRTVCDASSCLGFCRDFFVRG